MSDVPFKNPGWAGNTGEFDLSEKTFIRQYIRELVQARAKDAMPDATDEDRQNIPWIRVTDVASGTAKVFRTEEFTGEPPRDRIRTMDCIDCHNRPAHAFPTGRQMGDYLEAYARRFDLPVRSGVRVDRLTREGDGFEVRAGGRYVRARNVVVAMASYQRPRVPPFASELDRGIVQLHSADYRNPSQLQEGPVLVVGLSHSGADLAMEAATSGHRTFVSGAAHGQLPFSVDSRRARVAGGLDGAVEVRFDNCHPILPAGSMAIFQVILMPCICSIPGIPMAC